MVTVPSRYRLDVQGLRALAVVLVIMNHLFLWPTGGFAGVDVFFVISGFVITAKLISDQKSGRLNYLTFLTGRLRRLLPEALAVACVTIAGAWLLWHIPRAVQTTLDGVMSLLWVSNWHFAALGVDYLAANDAPSPFQHYWSLSVEEQFYLIWPWFVILGSLIKIRRRPQALMAFILIASLASFLWSFYFTHARPSLAYFDLIGRVWEFGVGALIAVLMPAIARLNANSREALAIVGTVGIIVSALLVTPTMPFPGPWAFPAVASTALVLVGADRRLLIKRPLVYIGDISYSLYLWHFPLIIFGTSLFGNSIPALITILFATLGLSWLSDKYVRKPFHRRVVDDAPTSEARISAPNWRGAPVGMALALTVATLAASQIRGPDNLVKADWIDLAGPPVATTAFHSRSQLTMAIEEGLRSKSWSGLSPSINESPTAMQSGAMNAKTGCRNDPTSTAGVRTCSYGNPKAPRTAWIVGDSVAMSWVPSIVAALGDGWSVKALGFASCSPFDVVTHPRVYTPETVVACGRAKSTMLDTVAAARPNLVVLSSDLGGYTRQFTNDTIERELNWERGVQNTLSHYRKAADRVVVLADPPLGVGLACATRISSPDSCTTDLSPEWEAKSRAESQASAAAGAIYVGTKDWFCVSRGCPAVIGNILVRTDTTHITEAMAESLGPIAAQSDLLG